MEFLLCGRSIPVTLTDMWTMLVGELRWIGLEKLNGAGAAPRVAEDLHSKRVRCAHSDALARRTVLPSMGQHPLALDHCHEFLGASSTQPPFIQVLLPGEWACGDSGNGRTATAPTGQFRGF